MFFFFYVKTPDEGRVDLMSSRLSVDCRCDGNKTDTDWLRCYETAALHLNSPLNMRTACKYHGIIKKPLKQVMFWLLMYNRESSSSSCFHPMQLLKASQLNTFQVVVPWLQIKKYIYFCTFLKHFKLYSHSSHPQQNSSDAAAEHRD